MHHEGLPKGVVKTPVEIAAQRDAFIEWGDIHLHGVKSLKKMESDRKNLVFRSFFFVFEVQKYV